MVNYHDRDTIWQRSVLSFLEATLPCADCLIWDPTTIEFAQHPVCNAYV